MADENQTQVEEPMQMGTETKASEGMPEGKGDGAADVQQLLATLEKVGVSEPSQIQGMADAAYQQGNTANLLGEARREIGELRTQVQALNQKPAPTQEDYYSGEGNSVDLRSEMRSVMRDFYRDEVIVPQQEVTRRNYQEAASIRGDADYALVVNDFNEHMTQPETQMKMAQGQTNLTTEYNAVVRKFYRDIAMQARDALKNVGLAPGQPAPHTETGQHGTQTALGKTERDRVNEGLRKVAEKSTGSDKDVEDMIDTLFPADDPFFKT